MKVLIVASYNKNRFAPFILEQAKALEERGIMVQFYGIKGRGVIGYLKNLKPLKQTIVAFNPDVIHAHFGLSGVVACMQRVVPVVVTYHGSDVDVRTNRILSHIAMRLAAWNIFVSEKNRRLSGLKAKCSIIPCGINIIPEMSFSKVDARQQLGWDKDEKYVLFASAFDNQVKNPELAFETIEELRKEVKIPINFVELKNLSRQEVATYMCASDALLLTSHHEGSPQVIKEALACGCPIVSVDVGDILERVEGVKGCFVVNAATPKVLAMSLSSAFDFEGKTNGRQKIIDDGLLNSQVAQRIIDIYNNLGV